MLGKGAFGLVSLVRSVLTGELVAMKTIDKSKLYTQNLKKTVEHEIRILKLLRHERIIGLYEVIEVSHAPRPCAPADPPFVLAFFDPSLPQTPPRSRRHARSTSSWSIRTAATCRST